MKTNIIRVSETTKALLTLKQIQEKLQNYLFGIEHLKQLNNKLNELNDTL